MSTDSPSKMKSQSFSSAISASRSRASTFHTRAKNWLKKQSKEDNEISSDEEPLMISGPIHLMEIPKLPSDPFVAEALEKCFKQDHLDSSPRELHYKKVLKFVNQEFLKQEYVNKRLNEKLSATCVLLRKILKYQYPSYLTEEGSEFQKALMDRMVEIEKRERFLNQQVHAMQAEIVNLNKIIESLKSAPGNTIEKDIESETLEKKVPKFSSPIKEPETISPEPVGDLVPFRSQSLYSRKTYNPKASLRGGVSLHQELEEQEVKRKNEEQEWREMVLKIRSKRISRTGGRRASIIFESLDDQLNQMEQNEKQEEET